MKVKKNFKIVKLFKLDLWFSEESLSILRQPGKDVHDYGPATQVLKRPNTRAYMYNIFICGGLLASIVLPAS